MNALASKAVLNTGASPLLLTGAEKPVPATDAEAGRICEDEDAGLRVVCTEGPPLDSVNGQLISLKIANAV